MATSDLPFAIYNLPLGLLPHLLLLIFFQYSLYVVGELVVENVWLRIGLSLLLSVVLFNLSQKSMELNFTRKDIPKTRKPPTTELLEKSMQIGDPLVDSIIEASTTMGVRTPIQYTKSFSYKHVEHLPAFQTLQGQLQSLPSWLDTKRIQKSSRFYRDNLTTVFGGLAMGLIESYMYTADAKVLEISGGLIELKGTMKRLSRTVQFVFDVMSLDGIPKFGSEPFNNIVNVRFIHSLVRRRVKASDRWDQPVEPVNLFAQTGTLIFFCHVPIEAMRSNGLESSPEQCECCWQLWRYVGYLMGIPDDLLPATYEEGLRLKEHPFTLARKVPSAASAALAINTINALDANPVIPFDVTTFTTACYQVFGESLYRKLNLPIPSKSSRFGVYLFHVWCRHVRLIDHYVVPCRWWKNYFFLRYVVTSGIIKASRDQQQFY